MDFKELRDKVMFDHEGSVENAKWIYDILEKAGEPTRETVGSYTTLRGSVSVWRFISWGTYWAGQTGAVDKPIIKISTLRKESENNAA